MYSILMIYEILSLIGALTGTRLVDLQVREEYPAGRGNYTIL